MSKKRVEKTKKSQHVRPTDRRSHINLSRGIYKPLDRRKQGNEPVLSRLHRGERGIDDGDEMIYDFNDYPSDFYQRGYAT